LEPDYLIGFKPGFAGLTASLKLGARIFLDGGVTQFRTNVEVSAPVGHRVRLLGKLFFVRSARMSGYDKLRDRAERYDLLRLGVGIIFELDAFGGLPFPHIQTGYDSFAQHVGILRSKYQLTNQKIF